MATLPIVFEVLLLQGASRASQHPLQLGSARSGCLLLLLLSYQRVKFGVSHGILEIFTRRLWKANDIHWLLTIGSLQHETYAI